MRRAGSTVSRTLGKVRRRSLCFMWDKGVYSVPSTRTGMMGASAFSATRAAPANTFIMAPVTVMRPSGKITRVRPSFTARTICLIASGLVVSTGKTSTKGRMGFIHQRLAMRLCRAKVGRPGRKAPSSTASR